MCHPSQSEDAKYNSVIYTTEERGNYVGKLTIERREKRNENILIKKSVVDV